MDDVAPAILEPSAARTRGSSAEPFATSCSNARRGRRCRLPRRGRSGSCVRARDRAARRSRSPSVTAPGARSLADGRTVDFTPLAGSLEDDLASRDFTINALATGRLDRPDRPFRGAVDLRDRTIRAVSAGRLPRRPASAAARSPARGRARVSLRCGDRDARPRARGSRLATSRRADPRRARAAFGRSASAGSTSSACWPSSAARSIAPTARRSSTPLITVWSAFWAGARAAAGLEAALCAMRGRCSPRRPPADGSPRSLHRFRRSTEPWALDALALAGADRSRTCPRRVARERPRRSRCCAATSSDFRQAPRSAALLDEIAEERAAGVVSTREEALELVRSRAR